MTHSVARWQAVRGKVETVGVAADPASRTYSGEDCRPEPGAAVAGGDGERGADLSSAMVERHHRAGQRDCARSARRGAGVRVLAGAAAGVCAAG